MSTPSGEGWGGPEERPGSGPPPTAQWSAPGPPPAPAPQWDSTSSGPAASPRGRASEFRRVGGLGTAALVLSALVTATYWLSALLSPAADQRYEEVVADGGNVNEVFTGYDASGLLALLAMIAAWIVTAVWLGRVRSNALVVQPDGQRRSAVWAWLGWIVPIVSLWFPKQILDDSAKATSREPVSTTPYWAAWIVMTVLSNLEFRLSFSAAPEDAVNPALEFGIAIAATVALVFWFSVVRRISAAQDALAAGGGARPY